MSVLFCQKDGRPDHIVLVRNPGVDPATRYYDSTNGEDIRYSDTAPQDVHPLNPSNPCEATSRPGSRSGTS